MSAIDQYLRQILVASYGEDVRRSIHDAINQNNIDVLDSVEKAEAAVDAAENALNTAEDAAENVEQALNKANAAVDAAEDAYEAAMGVSQLATIVNSASGEIASFSDGADAPVKNLSVGIEPVQDLHGYDSPWPGGGGKNLFDFKDSYENVSKVDGHIAVVTDKWLVGVTRNNNGNANNVQNPSIANKVLSFTSSIGGYGVGLFIPVSAETEYVASADMTNAGIGIGFHQADGTYISNAPSRENYSYTVFTTPANCAYAIVVITPNATNQIVTAKNIQLEKGATATSFVPYSNICPITGWTGAKVTRTGKNLFDGNRFPGFISDDGAEGVDGVSFHSDYIRVAEGKTYTYSLISNSVDSINRRIQAYDKNKQWVQIISKNSTSGNGAKSFSFTVPTNVEYVRVQFRGDATVANRDSDIQIELGSTATAYEPYAGQTYDITFPTEAVTVYGGTLTINEDGTGTLVKDRINIHVTGAREITSYGNAAEGYLHCRIYSGGTLLKYGPELVSSIVPMRNDISSTVIPASIGFRTVDNIAFIYLYIKIDGVTTIDELKTWFNNNPQDFVCPIYNTISLSLTATEVRTLLGQNNIWSDTGDVNVSYRADTKLYINGKIAEAIANALNA